MSDKWHIRFLKMAELVASWSKDPTRNVGAVLVRPDRTIAASGYNGFPRGCDDNPKFYDDRESKLSRIIHAEVNAILTCAEKPKGYTLYVFGKGVCPCCDRCATQIIQSGIKEVIYWHSHKCADMRWRKPIESAEQMLKEAGVKVRALKEKVLT